MTSSDDASWGSSPMGSSPLPHHMHQSWRMDVYSELEDGDEPIPSVLSDLATSNAFTAVVSAVPSLLHVANPLGQDLPAQTPALVQQSNTNVTTMVAAPTMAPLSQADHPSLRFWTQSDWRTVRVNLLMLTVPHTFEMLRTKLWFLLRERKIHPTTWGEVTAEADGIYKRGMACDSELPVVVQ